MMSASRSSLLSFTFIISILIHSVFSADCQSQASASKCGLVSGCEWFNNGCICATDVKVDIIFAMDRSGSIGSSAFQQSKEWLSDFVQGGVPKDSRIGFVYFASGVDASDITLKTWTTNALVSYISNIQYPGGATYTQLAVQESIKEYEKHGQDTRQKLVIMTTDGKPNRGDVCSDAPTVKSQNIRVIILGVGSGITIQYLECLLQNPSTDYIPVHSYNYDDFQNIMPALQQITCPVSYDMKLTEVKPQTDTNPAFGSKFIEIWNLGSTVNGAELQFDGLVSGSLPNTVAVKQSHYLVLYEIDDTFLNVTCVNCVCNSDFKSPYAQLSSTGYYCGDSLYFACSSNSPYCSFDDGTNYDKTNWKQEIYDVSNGAHELIDAVDITQHTPWPVILEGWTFALKKLGFENDAGGNWEQSCYNTGTPGDPPIVCPHAGCSTATCTQNGAQGASINPNTGFCTCPTQYYPTGCTCKKVPQPSNCMAERVKQNISTWYMLYTWDRVDYDEEIRYSLQYETDGGSTTTVTSYGQIKTVLNYDWQTRGIEQSAGTLRSFISVDDKDYYSQTAQCMPITQNPTVDPTTAPSISPTLAPTDNPTKSPIHVLPWLFIGGGICENDRCECGVSQLIRNKTCCLHDIANCTVYSRQYAFSDIAQYITIQSFDPFGNAYAAPFDTVAYYKFEYLGLQNLSDVYINDSDDSAAESECDDRKNKNKNKNKNKKQIYDGSPVMISPMNGSIMFNNLSSTKIRFYTDRTGNDAVECKGDAMFRLSLLNCNSSYTLNMEERCEIVYPHEYLLYVQQPANEAALSWWEREGKAMLWWLLAALAAILLLVAFLVYKFWWKTRLKGKAIADKENEMQGLIEQEELGMAPDLNNDQIGYNPLALGQQQGGGVGSGNVDMATHDEIPKNQRANVMVERFDERQQYGPNQGYQPPVTN